MERNKISVEQARAFVALRRNKERWITSTELAKVANIGERTGRLYLEKYSKLGLVDRIEVSPAYKYRLSEKASKRNAGYFGRLEKAREVFGLGAERIAAPERGGS